MSYEYQGGNILPPGAFRVCHRRQYIAAWHFSDTIYGGNILPPGPERAQMNDKDWTIQKRLLSARRASQMAVFDNEIERWGEVDVPYLHLSSSEASEYDESTSKVELVRCNVKVNHYSTRIDNLCKISKVTPESKIVLETLINKVKEVKKLVSEDKLTSEDVLAVNESC
ncbi:hypothetical protein J6590_061317 [Homalodisca vitripennis]|nr:hypothetical protein J6590_061317 [Homalodisca vitripennis]